MAWTLVVAGSVVAQAFWGAAPGRAEAEADTETEGSLEIPTLALPQSAPVAPPTNLPPSTIVLDRSMLPAASARTNVASRLPPPVGSSLVPPEPVFPVKTAPAPSVPDQPVAPVTSAASPAPPKDGPLLRVEPVRPRPIGDDEPYPLTEQERLRRPGYDPLKRNVARAAPVSSPQRGSLLDRIISSRSRSYALTNVSADTTNSIWKPLYNNEPDLRDYHPTERPEHVPAQEDEHRRPVP
ncbi:hypothetical protein HQ590_05505 [bacterium]|nr:hypothetical protein [bacterium]